MSLTGVVCRDVVVARPQEARLLRRAVEGGDHDGLATAALAEHGEVLLERSVYLHERNIVQRPVEKVRPSVTLSFSVDDRDRRSTALRRRMPGAFLGDGKRRPLTETDCPCPCDPISGCHEASAVDKRISSPPVGFAIGRNPSVWDWWQCAGDDASASAARYPKVARLHSWVWSVGRPRLSRHSVRQTERGRSAPPVRRPRRGPVGHRRRCAA